MKMYAKLLWHEHENLRVKALHIPAHCLFIYIYLF